MVRDSTRRRGPWPLEGRPFDGVALLLGLIIIALLLRAFIAGVYLPLSGFRVDVGDFTSWAQRLASRGPGGFYAPDYFSDYPPGYLYVLWALGSIGGFVGGFFGTDLTGGLVKIPAILADAGVAWLLFVFSRRFLDGRIGGRSGETIGLVAAIVYLFNPGTIFDSSVWGQVDSVGALVILATLYLLARGWTEAAAVGAVVALLIKFQYGFLIPVVAVVGLKRHLFGRSSEPEQDGRQDLLRVLTSLAAGIGSLVLLILPFRLAVWVPNDPTHSLWDKFVEAADTYHGLSINAFNLWRNPWSGLGDQIQWGCDAPGVPPDGCTGGIAFAIGSFDVTWQLVGMVLFAAVALLALWQVARRDDPVGLLMATLVLAVAFFALPTRVHERYLFPALVLAAPLVLRGWRWATLYGVLSLSFFANIYWVYTADWSFVSGPPTNPGLGGLPMTRDPFLASTLFTDWGIYLLSLMIVLTLGWLAWQAVRLAGARAQLALATEPMAAIPSTAPVVATEPRSSAGPPVAVGMSDIAPPPGWSSRFGWLRSDPRDPLLREPMRRLDRLDLLLVIGFVLFAFLFRLWRLDLPRSMHFDEVYHARSATEWLADWEHGWTRDVYEWTHPMLAKYLIAAGIVVADPNKLTATHPLPGKASALAVAPARSAVGHPRSVAFAGVGDRVVALDALDGTQLASWAAGMPVAALAYDAEGDRLLVGSAGSGEVRVFALDAFLSHAGPRAPPPQAPSLDSGLASVSRIVVTDDASIILLAGRDGIAELERATGASVATSQMPAADVAYLPPTGGSGDAAQPSHVVVATEGSDAVTLLDGGTLAEERTVSLPAASLGLLLSQGSGTDRQVWVPLGALPANDEHPAVSGGVTVLNEQGSVVDTVPLPGEARSLAWQRVANIVYIGGIAPDGKPQVWTVDPLGDERSGFAAFDTTALPGEPLAMAVDTTDLAEGDDNANLLVATSSGSAAELAVIDAGSNTFAWRLAGIVFGALLVGMIYLLAATMFRRRRIAVLAAAFVAVDGMSYVMSRIAMNDIYVAAFIVAAYLVFWQIWSGRWRRSAWWALPLVGVLIGLAAASKWVGWYALAGLLVLVLARSALGRLLLLVGVAFLTVVAGFGVPWPFTAVMLIGLALALVVVWVRPVHLRLADLVALPATGLVLGGVGLAFAIAYPQIPGRTPGSAVELVFALLARGTQAGWPAWILLGVAAALILLRAARSILRPASDAAWMAPRSLGGFGWAWIGACLVVIPLLVYFLSYIPYLELGHAVALKDTGPGYGWSLDELQAQMFGYHFGLQSGHPSASPWWSWPLDLKPTWFYGHDFADTRTGAVIYNGGNPLLFWAGIPALIYVGIQAWRRRSMALVLIVIAFAFQFLPWTRIERATFMYHYFTAVLFAMVAVAYALDDLLRSREWSSLGVAYLIGVGVVGVLVFPLGSAFAMPDWYINAAKALPPWNYYFQFPNPPQGDRGQLISVNAVKLVLGIAAAVAAGAFALYGRRWIDPPSGGAIATSEGGDQEGNAGDDKEDRPEAVPGDLRNVGPHQEPDA
jgi:predicted membrane-bound dolichyl-phosphate-mannose-protein mannosyltransferase/Gpi18-like mannosyltransferase